MRTDLSTEDRNIEKQLWVLMDGMVNEPEVQGPFALLQRAHEQGIPINGEFLEILVARRQDLGEFITPPFLADFIAAYCAESPPRRILDPCAGMGRLLAQLTTELQPVESVAIEVNRKAHDAARLLAQGVNVNWHLGDALVEIDNFTAPFDLIIGDPPLGMHPRTLLLTSSAGDVSVRDEVGHLILLRACQLLAPDGAAFFVVTPSFLLKRQPTSVHSLLTQFGLSLDAVLAIPRGTFRASSVETWLILIRRDINSKLFVGELSQTATNNRQLLQNLKERKEGKTIELGAMVDAAGFVSVRSLVAEREVIRLARGAGLVPTTMASLGAVVKVARRDDANSFTEAPNAVYLPVIGHSSAVTSTADFRLKPQNYLQMIFPVADTNSVYVAQFFNSPLGHRVREGMLRGAYIPKISAQSLQNSTLYLPSPAAQVKTLQINALISDMLAQLETQRRELWANPNRHKEIEKAVLLLNREDNFLAWVETLPYPLASILWAYETAPQADHKVRHLLHFFEAYAQFNVALLASGLVRDPAFEGNQMPVSTLQPLHGSFGVWTRLCREYGNRARRMNEAQESREKYQAFFGYPDADFFKLLTDKRIFALLDETKAFRDAWEGHGGSPTKSETDSRLATLQDRLAALRGMIEDRYKSALLLLPISTRWDEGLFHYQVHVVQGTRTPFVTRNVVTREPMESNNLYLLHNLQTAPVEVLPFVKLMSSPSSQLDTAYFYSRTKDGEAQWVSYQFAAASTQTTPEQVVRKVLPLLIPNDRLQKEQGNSTTE